MSNTLCYSLFKRDISYGFNNRFEGWSPPLANKGLGIIPFIIFWKIPSVQSIKIRLITHIKKGQAASGLPRELVMETKQKE